MGMAAATLATTAIGGLLQFRGAQAQAGAFRQQGELSEAEGEYRAAVNRNNAIRAEFLAEDAIGRGRREEREERLRGRLLIGAMRAGLAAQGVVVDQDSALELVVDQAEVNELNALTVRNNAAREAQEHRIRASQFEEEAQLNLIGGKNLRSQSDFEAEQSELAGFGTLLGSGTQVASKWYEFRRTGVIT